MRKTTSASIKLELYYTVNGGPEQKVDLFQNKGDRPKEISADAHVLPRRIRSGAGRFRYLLR